MRVYFEERAALGSTVRMGLVAEDTSVAERLLRKLWIDLLLFEKRCSRFLPDSELSQFNRSAGVRMPVSEEFRDALLAARRMAELTSGMFNPFILPALQRSGYSRSLVPGHAGEAVDDHSARRVTSSDKLEIGDTWAAIPYGTAIDLGGCGKGYIGDVLAAVVDGEPAVQGYWLSIGGDVIVNGCNDMGGPWTVYLQPDPKQQRRIGEVRVPEGQKLAVATSTTLLRKGIVETKTKTKTTIKKWHHIIDPSTGQPTDSDVTVMVICDGSLLRADVLASCGIIAGSAAMPEFLKQYDVPAAAWLTADANTDASQLATSGELITAYDKWTAYA